MSNMIPNDSSLQSTKQMLDELDALMDRMLALPVNEAGDAPAFPDEVVPEKAMGATLTLLQTPKPLLEMPLLEMPLHPILNPPHRPMAALEVVLPPAPPPLTNDVVPPSLSPQIEALLSRVPEGTAPTVSLAIYLPLLWINQAFDGCTLLLGDSGARLRTQTGRLLLAFVGVLLLAGSATWFLKDWLGWQW